MIDGKFAILAIESSCDETAAAVVLDGREARSNVISSQIAIQPGQRECPPRSEWITGASPGASRAQASASVALARSAVGCAPIRQATMDESKQSRMADR